ncbi:hypothetical protein AY601_1109 [Pedobacter cryoconitis]|uniref:Uncharacterized protein n=2 Tax=Pedobacter cryoconitis TaxID=188932 RepID=A0A127V9Z9_9SPHI|nr:hypothetical protein AY601_1109 [Pedobacter cryoconitis]
MSRPLSILLSIFCKTKQLKHLSIAKNYKYKTFSHPFAISCFFANVSNEQLTKMKLEFLKPDDSYKPGVYWYFMDGNMTAETMTKDLESMKKVGIGNLIFLEVNVGIPRGKAKL